MLKIVFFYKIYYYSTKFFIFLRVHAYTLKEKPLFWSAKMKKYKSNSSVAVIKQLKSGYSSKETFSGIIRIECEDGVSTLFASFINFSPLLGEEYFLFLQNCENRTIRIPLGKRPASLTKTFEDLIFDESGFIAGVCVVREEIPLLIGYAKTEKNAKDLKEFKKSIAEYCFNSYKRRASEKPSCAPPCKLNGVDNVCIETNENVYNDEVVATENYFAPTFDNDFTGVKNENLPHENDDVGIANVKETKKDQTCASVGEDENDNSTKKSYDAKNPYYLSAKRELEDIFLRFPSDETLIKLFPESKWVRVYYEKEKYYVVGVISENGVQKYICYGVPGEYSKYAPKELKGYCCFVPKSIFDLTGEGYWMMFQDAITGKCVKANKSKN